MPVPPQIGGMLGDYDEVSDSCGDIAVTAGTGVDLACLIRLDDVDHERSEWGFHQNQPSRAHSTTSTVITTKVATIATSVAVLSCCRKGLKPTARSVAALLSFR